MRLVVDDSDGIIRPDHAVDHAVLEVALDEGEPHRHDLGVGGQLRAGHEEVTLQLEQRGSQVGQRARQAVGSLERDAQWLQAKIVELQASQDPSHPLAQRLRSSARLAEEVDDKKGIYYRLGALYEEQLADIDRAALDASYLGPELLDLMLDVCSVWPAGPLIRTRL